MPRTLRRSPTAATIGLISLTSLLIVTGCHKKDDAAGTASSGGSLVAGQSLFQNNGCTRCHGINGQGGHMGPDLSHAGSDPRHTSVWLAAYVKNPRAVNPNSRMPSFGGRISDSDLNTLGTYLASLK